MGVPLPWTLLNEVGSLEATSNKVICCHFSFDGKLLASGGYGKRVILWDRDTLKIRNSAEEHSLVINDLRFSSYSTLLASCSFDRTIKVWDCKNLNCSLQTLSGHSATVSSIDFHPRNEELICSSDGNKKIRFWDVSQGICIKEFQGGVNHTRFQPILGRLLASASGNLISIFDVETTNCLQTLQGHIKPLHSLCWDATGSMMASVSEDSVKVWAFGSGNYYKCLHELSSFGNKFNSCVFHPTHQSLLIIGCCKSFVLWNMNEDKFITIPAHDSLISALTVCKSTGMIASAGHDKIVRLWK